MAAESHLLLHPEAFRILLVLRREALHGYAIVKELERDEERPGSVLPANPYRRIRTLQEAGLIEEVAAPGGGMGTRGATTIASHRKARP